MKFNISEENKNKPGIYIITNTIDNRVYIGKTWWLFERYKQHYLDLKGNKNVSKLQPFVNIHGVDCLTMSLLELTSRFDLAPREKYYVDKYNSTDERFGFNKQKVSGTDLYSGFYEYDLNNPLWKWLSDEERLSLYTKKNTLLDNIFIDSIKYYL